MSFFCCAVLIRLCLGFPLFHLGYDSGSFVILGWFQAKTCALQNAVEVDQSSVNTKFVNCQALIFHII